MTNMLKSSLLSILMAATVTFAFDNTFENGFTGKGYHLDDHDERLARFWIPDSIPVLRGILIDDVAVAPTHDSLSREISIRSVLWRFMVISYSEDPGRFGLSGASRIPFATIREGLAEIAQKSGHPELPNLPVSAAGQLPMDDISSAWGDLLISTSAEGVGDFVSNSKIVPNVKCVEESSYENPAGGFYGGCGDKQQCWAVQWGWGHGFLSQRDLDWPWHDQVIRNRIPQDWDPLSGPPQLQTIPESQAWYGDQNIIQTGENLWPYIAPANEYERSKSASVWLPNEYTAWVWRAYMSRHPSENMNDQGLSHVSGSSGNNGGKSGMPPISINQPSKPWHATRIRANNYPMFALGETIDIGTPHTSIEGLKKIEFYEGNHKLATLEPSVYRFYQTSATMTQPGIRSLIAVATVEEAGETKTITSRPSTIYVADSLVTAVAGEEVSLRRGISSQRAPGIARNGRKSVSVVFSKSGPASGGIDLRGRNTPQAKVNARGVIVRNK